MELTWKLWENMKPNKPGYYATWDPNYYEYLMCEWDGENFIPCETGCGCYPAFYVVPDKWMEIPLAD